MLLGAGLGCLAAFETCSSIAKEEGDKSREIQRASVQMELAQAMEALPVLKPHGIESCRCGRQQFSKWDEGQLKQ